MNTRAIDKAFNRSAPHPLDVRVRIVEDPADMVAIYSPHAASVIWRCEENMGILRASREIEEKAGGDPAWFPKTSQGVIDDLIEEQDLLPPVALGEFARLQAAFRVVAAFGNAHGCRSQTKNECHVRHLNTVEPHIDGEAGFGPARESAAMLRLSHLRAVTSFTMDENLTTEVYPVVASPLEHHLSTAGYAKAGDGEAYKESLGRWRVERGDVLLVKGFRYNVADTRPCPEALLHSKPLNTRNNIRIAHLNECTFRRPS